MPRLSTAMKRRKAIYSTHLMHRYWKGTHPGRQRMKSFATEELARAWGKEQEIDEGIHFVKELSPGKWQWKKKNKYLA